MTTSSPPRKNYQNKVNGFAVEIQRRAVTASVIILVFCNFFAFLQRRSNEMIGFAMDFLPSGTEPVKLSTLFYSRQWNTTAFRWFPSLSLAGVIILDALVVWWVEIRIGCTNGAEPEPA
jgi:hypothetical protein